MFAIQALKLNNIIGEMFKKIITHWKLLKNIYKNVLFIITGIISFLVIVFPNIFVTIFSKISTKCVILFLILFIPLICSFVYISVYKEYKLPGFNKIILHYDDFFSLINNKQNIIAVIPVNTAFDTTITKLNDKTKKMLVSENTIHGKWIQYVEKRGLSKNGIDDNIEKSVKRYKIKFKKDNHRIIGKKKIFNRGTIIPVDYDNIHYYLLALSSFDSDNVAHCSKEELVSVINNLISYYAKDGMGYDIYMPLIGSGLSRTNLSTQQTLDLIVSLLRVKYDKLQVQGSIHIVVYDKIRDQVSISQ